jgi:hypothetical protein
MREMALMVLSTWLRNWRPRKSKTKSFAVGYDFRPRQDSPALANFEFELKTVKSWYQVGTISPSSKNLDQRTEEIQT